MNLLNRNLNEKEYKKKKKLTTIELNEEFLEVKMNVQSRTSLLKFAHNLIKLGAFCGNQMTWTVWGQKWFKHIY